MFCSCRSYQRCGQWAYDGTLITTGNVGKGKAGKQILRVCGMRPKRWMAMH